MKGKGVLLQLQNVLQAFQFSRSHTHRYKTSLSKYGVYWQNKVVATTDSVC